MRTIHLLFGILFIFFITAPVLFRVDKKIKLHGEMRTSKEVPLNLNSFLNQKYQEFFKRNLRKQSSLWPIMVKSDRQLNYWFFNQLSSNYDSQVVIGKDSHLIEKGYLYNFFGLKTSKWERIEKRVKQIRVFQDLLEKKGIGFLLLISANKLDIHPETIPNRYKIQKLNQTNYERAIPYLDQYKINYFDAVAYLKKQKRESKYPVFATSGTHWNNYSACLISNKISEKFSEQLLKNTSKIDCRLKDKFSFPAYIDRDLTRLANIWTPEVFYTYQPKPKNIAIKKEGDFRPNVLYIGSSFMWSIFDYLDRHLIHRKRDFFYYFKRRDSFPRRQSEPIDPTSLDWEKEVFSKDFVVIEINSSSVYKAGWGFLKNF